MPPAIWLRREMVPRPLPISSCTSRAMRRRRAASSRRRSRRPRHQKRIVAKPSAAMRAVPQATERPQKGPDYLTQLQKPVVQAKVNLENEELARQQAAEMRAAQQRSAQRGNRYSKGEVFDWNMPEFSENTASDERAQVQEKSPAASSDPATYDPFAEFMTPRNLQNPKPAESRRGAERASAPAASRQVAAPRREAPAPAAPSSPARRPRSG